MCSHEKIIKTKFNTFIDFKKSVDLLNDNFYKFIHDQYIFRGESSASFKLLPSILREERFDEIINMPFLGEFDKTKITEEVFINVEYQIIRYFYDMVLKQGLQVPNCEILKNNFNKLNPVELNNVLSSYNKWPIEDIIPVAALAQHYGVPTRLLDWSYDLNVALYFAAIGSLNNQSKKENGEDYLVIWALDLATLENISLKNEFQLKLTTPLYHDNPNLRAQKGILSYIEIPINANQLANPISRITLSDYISPLCCTIERPLLIQFMIPVSEAKEIIRYLFLSGYGTERLFPGYSGCVQSMNEEKLWRE